LSHSLIGKLLNDFVSKNLKFKFTDAWHICVRHSVTLKQYILRADWNSPSIHIPLLLGEIQQALMFRLRECFLTLRAGIVVHGFHGTHAKEHFFQRASVSISEIRGVRVQKSLLRNSL
jgi:hypothetical protein